MSFIHSIQLYYFNSDVLIFQNPFSSFQPIFFEDLLFELNYHEALKVFDFLLFLLQSFFRTKIS
jgi:hypothetical protein